MKVLLAEKCGFCPGVRSAIRTAEKVLAQAAGQQPVFSLGPIIHNPTEVNRLAAAGLITVESADQIDRGIVLIRSHGAAPAQVAALKAKGLTIIDATCVLVKRLQRIATDLEGSGYQVLIVGQPDHPEVQAVCGYLKRPIVVCTQGDLANVPLDKRLGIVSQTTLSPQRFASMVAAICKGSFTELKVVNTLCRESCKRQEAAVRLCKQVDVMFVLGGLQSANTRSLAELCRAHNPNTYHLEGIQDLDVDVLRGKTDAGVTAGASTPDSVIESFVDQLQQL
ncbi:MAG: 4-hydroxy-3-methylbut-2-enyl diphosphate reductase [Sedimentisphaerales bacterium]|nr:4-hydroxy-3-methylbut-2-enyl diphosphate reductase [Sedimentisphaerales bacterium]